jgi:putative PIN family toxin of toxin-antitoxin system
MSEPARPAVTFDCMTYLQATASPAGPAAACLRLVETVRVRLLTSQTILDEVRDVLERPRIRKKNPRLTDELVGAFLAHVVSLAPPAAVVPTAFTYPRDPKDEPYLNLAIAEKAEVLVSWDNDLLDLMKPDNPDGQRLRALAPGLRILTPPDFLGVIRAADAARTPDAGPASAGPSAPSGESQSANDEAPGDRPGP